MLNSGTKLGAYEVTGALGAGGMGEVYRARDTRLNRDVAIKVLPETVARDAERMVRFRREAQLLASLNHPNIAAIYGFEDSGATHALVMELVEGPTLAERIKGGAIPLDEALPIAKQICEALEYAHERGIVHRDLKPANIKLASNDKISGNDAVKILDFGLAKALEGDPAAMDISSSPTITRMATQAGIILGTAAYMSPEQAKGKSVDRRTDIWAFGCVLYEMLTSRMAFSGETVTDTLAAVIRGEPEWTLLPASTPAAIRNLLQRCLKKDPRQRLQSIGDARITLEEILSGAGQQESVQYDSSAGGAKPPLPIPASRWSSGLPWATAATLAVVAALLAVAYFLHGPSATNAPSALAYIPPPPGNSFRSYGFGAGPVVVSPDGQNLAFSATDQKGITRIWVRPLASDEATALAGTEDGAAPFWSADGQSLGFFADGKLKTVAVQSGTTQVLADSTCAHPSGTWSKQGVIVFTPQCGGALFKISATGGTPQPAVQPEADEAALSAPAFLGDSDEFLYTAHDEKGVGSVRMASVNGGRPQTVMRQARAAEFASGDLLFLREGRVFAQAFNPKNDTLAGKVMPVGEALSFSASANGVLAFQGGTASARLEWFDRSGNSVGSIGEVQDQDAPKISPNGKDVLIEKIGPGSTDLWTYPAMEGPGQRLTFDAGRKGFTVWSPDGKFIAYSCSAGGLPAICRKPADGSGAEETLLKLGSDAAGALVVDWSPDGRYLSFDEERAKDGVQANWILPLDGGKKPFQSAPISANQYDGNFSPDGHWLAYFSYETGRPEVFVVPFPPTGAKYQVSQTGGWLVRWAAGDRLFYVTMGNRLMEADLAASGNSLQVKSIEPLFQLSLPTTLAPMFDVTKDGNRFVVDTSADPLAASAITVLLNWPEALKKQLGTNSAQ